jgi:hypothetical protein
MTTFYYLRFETLPTWRARSSYIYPPGTGWPIYTPGHRVPVSSPPKTCEKKLSWTNWIEETMKNLRVVTVPSDIRTWNLPSRSQKYYRLSYLAWFVDFSFMLAHLIMLSHLCMLVFMYTVFIVQAYQTSHYAVPCGGIFLGKWSISFAGSSEGKMNPIECNGTF